MKLLFKQRIFSWFDSYDIYNEAVNSAADYLLKNYDNARNISGSISGSGSSSGIKSSALYRSVLF